MKVRTRFAPSPTGLLHIGGARTALFCWLYAKHCEGDFILRVEDTDRERSTKSATEVILEGLQWLGLQWDEGPYFQTERSDSYKAAVERLLASGHAYHCYCTRDELQAMRAEQEANGKKPRYDGRCRDRKTPRLGVDPVVRFRMPTVGQTAIDDHVRGRVTFENSELDDLIIQRSDGTPTYNLTVVVDDADMAITHVIRGDDHLNNTPKQLQIFQALEVKLPEFAHIPMILGPDGKKLSKRHGAASVLEYRTAGYLPEAMLNYLVRLGWSHGDQELFSREEMISLFDLSELNQSAAAINTAKLDWINQHYMKQAKVELLVDGLKDQLTKLGVDSSGAIDLGLVVQAFRERTKTLREMAENSRFFFCAPTSYEEKAVKKHLKNSGMQVLTAARKRLESLDGWTGASIHEVIETLAQSLGVGLGKVAQPIRIAVSGTSVSPPIDQTLVILGKAESLRRIKSAEELIPKMLAGV